MNFQLSIGMQKGPPIGVKNGLTAVWPHGNNNLGVL
jgi:hypothetical protein